MTSVLDALPIPICNGRARPSSLLDRRGTIGVGCHENLAERRREVRPAEGAELETNWEENSPKLYRALKKSGTLDQILDSRVEQAILVIPSAK